jgi:hypothetical protein
MTRYTKDSHGHYIIHGHKYEMLEGSRAQVLHGTAYKTSGGLKKHELLQNKNGRIVSRKKHHTAKKERRLVKAGYGTKKGKFGYVKLGKSKKMRGGKGAALSPAPLDLGADVPASPYQSVGGSRRRRKHRGGSGAAVAMPSSLSQAVKALGASVPATAVAPVKATK